MSEQALGDVEFEALHAVRVRGITSGDDLGALDALESAGLVKHRTGGRREGWVITADGMRRHDAEIATRRSPEMAAAVEPAYHEFLAVNGTFKELCTDWQTLGAADPAARSAFAEELADVTGPAGAALSKAAAVAPWFAAYEERLQAAVRTFEGGDDAFLTSPLVDSVHTIWAQGHEDFLVTLGRERSEADGA